MNSGHNWNAEDICRCWQKTDEQKTFMMRHFKKLIKGEDFATRGSEEEKNNRKKLNQVINLALEHYITSQKDHLALIEASKHVQQVLC